MLVPTGRLIRAVNENITAGGSVPVLAFQCAGRMIAGRESVDRYVAARLRRGDLLAFAPRIGAYLVAFTGPVREQQQDSDAVFDAATRRIGRAFRDAAGTPFAAVWRRFHRPTTPSALSRMLRVALDAHVERRRALARIAHELRSPLCSIRGYLELLETCGNGPGERAYVQTARAETLRLGRMLDGMVEFSLLEGNAASEALSCDVSAAVERAVAAMRPRALRGGVDVRIAARTRRVAHVAPDDCIRATTNVLDNAINAGARSVIVASISRHDGVGVTIDDDGPGVRAAERAKIFACGHRGEAAINYSGSGFGLAAVHAIVRSCGGTVSAARSPLGGARFSLRFRPADRFEKRPR
ncbi:MAG TPA: HAMP domain-containing sensor histidine kinase [Candidatus Tumulicola sp.]|jgi:signal transduction histidine kinase